MWSVLGPTYDTRICLRDRRRIGHYGESWDLVSMRTMFGTKKV